MANHAQGKNKCPYWSTEDGRCTVSGNGLFIPLETHIINYCSTENHPNCSQYKAELARQESARMKASVNRRKNPRIPIERGVTLYQISETGAIIRQPEGNVQLIDLSSGGMKIDSPEPLVLDTLINFSFDSETAIHPTDKGTAKVKWCVFEKESRKYYAGLAFQEIPGTNDEASLALQPSH